MPSLTKLPSSAIRRSTWPPGKAAGVFTIAVAWGKIHPARRSAEADALVETPQELLDVL